MLEVPIFHVNADDPEAVVFVTRLALKYRMRFHKDVVIDLVCYRRHGHNEADEPAATQPLMYRIIREHPTARRLYADRLLAERVLTRGGRAGDVRAVPRGARRGPSAGARLPRHDRQQVHGRLERLRAGRLDRARVDRCRAGAPARARRAHYHSAAGLHAASARGAAHGQPPQDGAGRAAARLGLRRDARLRGASRGRLRGAHLPARTAAAARSSIATRCCTIRSTDATWIPLQHVAATQPRVQIIDSVLSEEAVLGFEYGYSTTEPHSLVVWEAQFGDFANGAQVIIDQFISSGEAKWERFCGLALFLPHGYEGAGPEHSSARLERFLQLCAENNMQVCVPSTPAQMFHMLRRQMLPAVSQAADRDDAEEPAASRAVGVARSRSSTRGGFARVIGEIDELPPAAGAPRRVLQRQGVLRPAEGAAQGGAARCGAACASSSSTRFRARSTRPLLNRYPERARGRVVPGGAAEPGRLVPDPPSPAGAGAGTPPGAVRRTRTRRRTGHRHHQDSRDRAAGAGRRGAAFEHHRGVRSRDHAPHRIASCGREPAPAALPAASPSPAPIRKRS